VEAAAARKAPYSPYTKAFVVVMCCILSRNHFSCTPSARVVFVGTAVQQCNDAAILMPARGLSSRPRTDRQRWGRGLREDGLRPGALATFVWRCGVSSHLPPRARHLRQQVFKSFPAAAALRLAQAPVCQCHSMPAKADGLLIYSQNAAVECIPCRLYAVNFKPPSHAGSFNLSFEPYYSDETL